MRKRLPVLTILSIGVLIQICPLVLHSSGQTAAGAQGKLAHLIAVEGEPLKDITELQRVKFVLKGEEQASLK